MLSDRTKLVRGVLGFLAGCAVLGFILGLKGAMPGRVDPVTEPRPLAATQSGVVIEATAQENTAPLPEEEKEEAPEEEKAEPAPAPAPESPKVEIPAAPKEEAPPADPVGDLLAPPATTPPPNIY
jgi:hypothetical protein